ncbi:MAG: hypothetical protein LUC44_06565 [Prevotellaceae bacterium]|nr:hypothetical protein [Prevotellaceae bacterium]
MKRKVFSSLLLLVTMVSAGSMLFVSCKDYDDDINDLREQITANATDLTSLVSEKVANVQTEINDLQAQSEALRAAYEAADQALQATMETSIASALASANGYADTQAGKANAYTDSKVAAANSYADAQALAAQTAAIAAAQNAVDAAAASLQASLAAATATLEAQGISIDGINSSLMSQGNSIAELQANVEALVTADATLTEGISAAQARADEAYSLAQSAQTLAETNASALESLKAVVESNNTTLEGKVETINNAVSANTSSIESLKSAVTGLQTSVGNLDSQISVLQGDVASVLEKANGNATDIASLSSQLSSLSQSNEALKTALVTQLKDYVESLKSATGSNADAITALQKALAECESKITANNGSILTNAENIQANAEAIASLNSIVSELQGSSTGSIQNLMQTYQQLSEKVDQNQADIQAALNENVNALNSSIQAAVLAANVYADAAAADVAATLGEQIATAQNAANAANASLEDLKVAYAAADKELQDQITELSNSVNASLTTLSQAIEDAKTQISANQNAVDAVNKALMDYAKSDDLEKANLVLDSLKIELGLTNKTFDGYVTSLALTQILGDYLKAADLPYIITMEDVRGELEKALADNATQSDLESALNAVSEKYTTKEAFNTAVEGLQSQLDAISENTITDLRNQINDHTAQISSLQDDVTTLFGYINETKRLKGLVFAPATYLGGIPCIRLATLKYTDWGEDLEADAAKEGNAEHTISLDTQVEEYLLNPSSVQEGSIDTLSFVANTATEVGTRAVTDKAPIEVVGKKIDKNDKGLSVLQVTLKKTSHEPFVLGDEDFTIVALKADIADAYLTADEKEAGEKVSVYSDWARLYETSKTPQIHYSNAVDKANDKLDEKADTAHFWKFSEVYGEGKGKNDVVASTVTTDHVLMSLPYDGEVYVLDSLVMVCDGEGATYDCATYGFEFEYHLVPYLVGEETENGVNQSSFAQIEGSSIIAKGSEETENKREAIGHTPVIQVVLKDTVNKAVVDVRYFQIQWIDKTAKNDYDQPFEDEQSYVCGGNADTPDEGSKGYQVKITADEVAQMCASLGIGENEFFSTYQLQTGLYASPEEAHKFIVEGEEPKSDPNIGTIAQNDADHGITWTISDKDGAQLPQPTQEEYDDHKMTIRAWGVYKSESGTNIVTFPLILTLKLPKFELAATHTLGTWENDVLNIPPTQYETDKKCEITGSLLGSYSIGDKHCEVIDSLITSDTSEKAVPSFVFVDGNGFYATESGDSLYFGEDLTEKGNLAAILDEEGTIKLCTDEEGNATEGARNLVGNQAKVKLVVNYCSLPEIPIEEFSVKFLQPLNITPSEDVERPLGTIYDLDADQSLPIHDTYYLQQNRYDTSLYVASDYTDQASQLAEGYSKFYGVGSPEYDTDEATWFFKTSGDERKGSALSGYSLEVQESKITYKRTIDTALAEDIEVTIPVTISSYWQTFHYNATLTIKRGTNGNPDLIKRK